MTKVKTEDSSKLTDFKALSFDVYGTLVDEKGGMFKALQPLISRLATPNPYTNNKWHTMDVFQRFEKQYQRSHPNLPFNELLPLAYNDFATFLGLPPPPAEEAATFGSSMGTYPAFPDTVAAVRALKRHYKLVILSNIDNASIRRTIEGPLKGVDFDLVLTAQQIGSYKPDLRNFNYLFEKVQKELGVDKAQILHTANSLAHDHVPAKKMGMHSAWIDREDNKKLREELGSEVDFTWRFTSMGEMAQAVNKEAPQSE